MRSFLVVSSCAAMCSGSTVTPVQKVLQMMSEMVAKGQKAMADENRIMATYNEWVSDEETRLSQNVEFATKEIEKLTAFITKTDNDIATLGSEIVELDALIQQKEGELAEATSIRASEKGEYDATQQDLAESVDAIGRAIDKLKSEDYDRPQAMMLLQKMAVEAPGMSTVLAAFLQQTATEREPGAPEVAAYENQSGGIVEMLEGLLAKFEKELGEVESAETAKSQNFDLNKIQLNDLIKYSQKNRDEKATTKADLSAQSAKANGELGDTKFSMAADKKMLADMTSVHVEKNQIFAANQEVRKAELEALNKAIEIISAPNVADSYAGNINLVQQPSFLQTRSTSERVLAKVRVAELLKKRARALSSDMLAKAAEEVAANPFSKVVDMIKSLLSKLKEEAAAEADHKAWCDKELKDNKMKRNKKTAQSEKLRAQIDDLKANIDTMAKKIVTLLKEQEDLTKAMGEATVDRNEEKAKNKAAIADAQAGSAAVKSALVVLRDFYMAQEGSFVQQAPEMKAYSGMASAKGGVVGMLEVIVSDFVRLEAETKGAETRAAAEYASFMADAKADKIAKHKEEVKTKLEKDQTEFDQSNAEKMLDGVDEELASATGYFERLKPECIEVKVSFEERVAARKAEVAALKDAYQLLDQKTVGE